MVVSKALWELIGYEPHAKQAEFHRSNARFKVASCGRRFGKSRMAAAEVEPKIMEPGTRGWIVGPEYKVGEKEFRYIWDDLVIKMRLGGAKGALRRKAYNVRTGEMYIETGWGSRVDVMSADHPDSLVGEGLDWVIISESAKQNPAIWDKYIRPALADKRGTAIFPSTPEGFNWFYEKFQQGQNGRDPQWESWRYPSWENPYVYPLGFEDPEIQTQMGTPEGTAWFWQEIGADFRAVVGLIYEEWDESVHVKPIRYRPEWGNFMAFDFGFTNPFVGLDIMVDPSDNVYIWREYYERGHPTWYHAQTLSGRPNPDGYHIDGGFGDSADPASVETLGMQFTPVIAMAEAKEWSQGVQEVKKFLAHSDSNPPRLYVDPSCVETINEFNNYRIKKPVRNADPRQNKAELPEKREDHSMDALRYFIMHKFVLGADTHLEEFMVERDDFDVEDEGGGVGRGIFTFSDDDRMVL